MMNGATPDGPDIAGPSPGMSRLDAPSRGAIDCDVHPAVPGMAALLPYLDEYWREQVTVRGIDGLDLAPAIR